MGTFFKGLILFFAVFSSLSLAVMNTRKGDWIGSGGAGISLSPTLVMISPQVEYVYEPGTMFGVLSQLGFGSEGLLFTGTGTARLLFAPHGKIQPALEGGLGFAVASTLFDQSFGVHILLGLGADYEIDKTTAVGTMIRLNFAPPLKSFFISWPLLIGRFIL